MTAHPETLPPLSILLVEDDINTLDILASILVRKYPNATLLCAANGKAGLEIFAAHLPDIVITDINMPVMGGVEMAVKSRVIKAETKFIALTGDTETIVCADAVDPESVFDVKLVKPVVFGLLFAAIEQLNHLIPKGKQV